MDLFALLRFMGEGGKRYSFSNLNSLLHATPPLPGNALLQAATYGTVSHVVILLSLSFVVD